MRNIARKFSIYAVSGMLSMTFFAAELAAAPKGLPKGGDPWGWIRALGGLVRGVLDAINVPVPGK